MPAPDRGFYPRLFLLVTGLSLVLALTIELIHPGHYERLLFSGWSGEGRDFLIGAYWCLSKIATVLGAAERGDAHASSLSLRYEKLVDQQLALADFRLDLHDSCGIPGRFCRVSAWKPDLNSL